MLVGFFVHVEFDLIHAVPVDAAFGKNRKVGPIFDGAVGSVRIGGIGRVGIVGGIVVVVVIIILSALIDVFIVCSTIGRDE